MAKKNILLVEGKDDEHVVKHICNHYRFPFIDEIKDCGGFENLIQSFPVRLKESDIANLGVLIDADTSISSRWQSIQNHLHRSGYQDVETIPRADGTILDAMESKLLPRVGVWLMPNNQTSGILEDFLRFLIPENDPLFLHVERSVAGIPEALRRFTSMGLPQVLIHTWLAWQREPGKPLGLAITAKYLDASMPEAQRFAEWLRRMFFA